MASDLTVFVRGADGDLATQVSDDIVRTAESLGSTAYAFPGVRTDSPHPRSEFRGLFDPAGSPGALTTIDSEYMLVVYEDVVPTPDLLEALWSQRHTADALVVPRRAIVPRAETIRERSARPVERFVSGFLALGTEDVSCALALYRRDLLEDVARRGGNVDSRLEVLAYAAVGGWQVRSLPDLTEVRLRGKLPSERRVFSRDFLKGVYGMWTQRNSIAAADYDMRAYHSWIPPQRWWQHRRHDLLLEMAKDKLDGRVLNVGCGSSQLLLDLQGSVGLDVLHHKLRYMRRYERNPLVAGSIFQLPFQDQTFDCLVCGEVIEHVPAEPSPLAEMVRVLRPDGRLVVSTPDYSTFWWPRIEKAYGRLHPHGYADEHITHYTRESLTAEMRSLGWRAVGFDYVAKAVMVGSFERAL
ncbi:MAG: methyltransferase domain-containing protein [Actinomycetota bacterium]|nr:methyltransferase domain-containing protein [Actinomycetota bacterium]